MPRRWSEKKLIDEEVNDAENVFNIQFIGRAMSWVVRREPVQIITVIDCWSNLIDYRAKPDRRDSIAQNTQTETYFYTKPIISLMLKSSRIITALWQYTLRAIGMHFTIRIDIVYVFIQTQLCRAVSCGVLRMLDNFNYGQFHLSLAFSYFQFLIYVALIENYEVNKKSSHFALLCARSIMRFSRFEYANLRAFLRWKFLLDSLTAHATLSTWCNQCYKQSVCLRTI